MSEMLDMTPAVVEGTLSFYTLFFRRPVGKYMLQVCRGLACAINGAENIMAYFREKLGVGHLETTDDGLFSYEEVECLAACDRAPCMQVNLEFVYDLTPEMIDEMLAAMRAGTYAVKPLAQTDAARTHVGDTSGRASGEPDAKSPGAIGVSSPNNAGGVGDAERRDHARPHHQRRRRILHETRASAPSSIRVRSSTRSTKRGQSCRSLRF